MDLLESLKKHFGWPGFRGSQESIVRATLAGKNTMVIMPTGMGKSLCYQLPTKMQRGLTVVISPLIALMKDQVDQLLKKNFKAVAINSTLKKDLREKAYRQLENQELEIVYVTPERFRKPDFIKAVTKNKISLLAVDEAHCISEWGHDFRPEYSRLGEIRAELGNPVTMALTATATLEVQEDILKQLNLSRENTDVFIEGIDRPNLFVAVSDLHGFESKVNRFLEIRSKHPGSAIIYFSLVSSLYEFSNALDKKKIPHFIYHGELSPAERKRSQEGFLNSQDQLILATPAFGLGIDKSDIHLIVHAEIPGAIESYYQEIGRAGRDGRKSHCELLYDQDDITIQMDFIKWSNPDPDFIKTVYHLVKNNLARFKQEGFEFLRKQMNFYNTRDFRVETALNLLQRWGSLEGEFRLRNIEVLDEPSGPYMDKGLYQKRLKNQNVKLLDMVKLAKTDECRKATVYKYFGVTDVKDCGFCDNCQLM